MPQKNLQTLPVSSSSEYSIHLWPTQEERRSLDWRSVKGICWRRRKILLAIFCATLLTCILLSLMMPKSYRASATLQINTASAYTSENELPVLADLTGLNRNRSLITQAEILQNDVVRDKALGLLPPNQRQFVGSRSVAVKTIPETDLITLTASSRNPEAAAGMANALGQAYLDLSEEKSRGQYASARKYVGVQLEASRARLDAVRAQLRRFKEANGTFDLATETQQQIAELNRLKSEWSQARANKVAAQAQVNRLKTLVGGMPETVVINSTITRSPQLIALQTRLTELEVQRIRANEVFQPGSREVRKLNSEISSLKSQLTTVAQTQTESRQTAKNPVRMETDQAVTRLQGEVWSQEARGVALKALTLKLESNLKKLPAREQRLGQLNTELTGLQQSFGTLNQKFQTLRASEAANVASGALLFPAQIPDSPIKRLTPFNLALFLVLSALVALGTAGLLDKRDDKVRSERDLPRDALVPLLAQIPTIGVHGEQYLFNTKAMISPLLENFRTLRTMIALGSAGQQAINPRTLVVTSCLPAEGKSLVAVNLAVAAALSGESVILVDCDLRWPSLHKLSGRNNDVGFINVANGETTLQAALQSTKVPGLRVLTSGPRSDNPFHALTSRAGREILLSLSEMADLVIIDSPPVLVLADTRVLALQADGVLLVVSTDKPGKEDVLAAENLLKQTGAQLVGVVLNKVEEGPEFRDYYKMYPYFSDSFKTGAGDTNDTKNLSLMPHSGGARGQ